MARSGLFEYPGWIGKFFRWLITFYGAFPVRRWTADFRAVRTAIRLLRAGEVVLIFPEGDINWSSEELMRFLKGAAFIARYTGAQVVHGAVCNSGKVWPHKTNPMPRMLFANLRVTWGEPKKYPFQGTTSKEVAEDMFQIVLRLLKTCCD
jgi:1-acyl-sn-glycerol-3-phosphate acyltransferase